MQGFVPGLYPRSEELVQATRDLDRGRTTPEAVDEQRARDLSELVDVQRKAGLEPLADGMLAWQDLFRPLVEEADGLKTGALTRFLDTNTFYRAPEATNGEPQLSARLDERYVASLPGPRIVTLPSPFALSLGTRLEPSVLAEGVLKPAIDGVEAELIVLAEPFLAREETVDLGALAGALEKLSGGPPLALWVTFGDATELLKQGLADLPVDGIGVDFYATPATALPGSLGKLLLAGVLDARSSVLEDPQEIASFAAELAQRAERLALVPNGDLQYVSESIARQKLARLGEATTLKAEAVA